MDKIKDATEIAKEFYKENDITLPEEEKPEENKSDSEDKKQTEEPKEEPKDKGAKEEDEQLSDDDKKLIETPDDQLDDETKTKKEEIVKRRKDWKDEKRWGKLTSQLKSMEEQQNMDRKALEELRIEKEALEKKLEVKKQPQDSIDTILLTKEKERINKYVSEDAELPREKRREMSNEELEEWIVEDLVAAQKWMVRQELRREKELEADKKEYTQSLEQNSIKAQQEVAMQKFIARNPELNVKDTVDALTKEGKTRQEIEEILIKDNPKYRVMKEIMADTETFMQFKDKPNGPDLLEEEMMKRLKEPEVDTEKQALLDRIAELEDAVNVGGREPVGTGIVSRSRGGGKMEGKNNPDVDRVLAMVNKKGHKIDVDEYKAMQERRKTIKGSGEYEDGIENSGSKI